MAGWNVTFSRDGDHVQMSDGLIEEPRFLIGNHVGALKSQPEYANLRILALRSAFLRTRLAMGDPTRDDFRDDILWMRINGLLNSALLPEFVYDASRVDDILERLAFESNKSTKTYVARAYFRFAGPRLASALPFTSIGTIRPMSTDERAELVRSLRFYLDAGLTASVASMFRTVLELRFESCANISRAQLPRPLDYQTALRLPVGRVAFASASIEIASVFGSGPYPTLLPHRKSLWHGDELALLPEVTLKDEDVIRAVACFDRLNDAPNARLISTAVRRYNDALERTRLDDALVDCVVALESILTRDAKTEVLRRLRQRLAFTIGRTPDDRVDVYKAISKIYDARSAIAHGSAPSAQLPRLLRRTEDYLGRLLSRLLTDSETFDAAAVDLAIVRGNAAFAFD